MKTIQDAIDQLKRVKEDGVSDLNENEAVDLFIKIDDIISHIPAIDETYNTNEFVYTEMITLKHVLYRLATQVLSDGPEYEYLDECVQQAIDQLVTTYSSVLP